MSDINYDDVKDTIYDMIRDNNHYIADQIENMANDKNDYPYSIENKKLIIEIAKVIRSIA